MSQTVLTMVTKASQPASVLLDEPMESVIQRVRQLWDVTDRTPIAMMMAIIQGSDDFQLLPIMHSVRVPTVVVDLISEEISWSIGEGEELAVEPLAKETLNC